MPKLFIKEPTRLSISKDLANAIKNGVLPKNAEKIFDLAILDDGLQQKNIEYDLKIVCINSYEGFGNNFLLPAGPLRENLYELKN